jgi:hypothetical protein
MKRDITGFGDVYFFVLSGSAYIDELDSFRVVLEEGREFFWGDSEHIFREDYS